MPKITELKVEVKKPESVSSGSGSTKGKAASGRSAVAGKSKWKLESSVSGKKSWA